jgi:calcineurin-like phosphoesterase family protein
MSIWYTSDLHLGHANIIKYCDRPFKSADEMNRTIVNNWNSVVKPEDRVFVLGDVALGKINESLEFVRELNGQKLLIPGNHDRCWSGHKEIRPIDRTMYEDVGFKIIGEDVINIHGWRLCHFPYEGDSHDGDRFDSHRPVKGSERILVHGHVHEKWIVNGDQINVGVDVWDFMPVHESEIKKFMSLWLT